MAGRKVTARKRRHLVVAAYIAVSTAASVLFYVAARAKAATATYSLLGVVWVFALSAIVSASLLPPLFERLRQRSEAAT